MNRGRFWIDSGSTLGRLRIGSGAIHNTLDIFSIVSGSIDDAPMGTAANAAVASKIESAAIEADAAAAVEAPWTQPQIDTDSYPDRIRNNAEPHQNRLRITLGRFWGFLWVDSRLLLGRMV